MNLIVSQDPSAGLKFRPKHYDHLFVACYQNCSDLLRQDGEGQVVVPTHLTGHVFPTHLTDAQLD